jgi:hypothetical protein
MDSCGIVSSLNGKNRKYMYCGQVQVYKRIVSGHRDHSPNRACMFLGGFVMHQSEFGSYLFLRPLVSFEIAVKSAG